MRRDTAKVSEFLGARRRAQARRGESALPARGVAAGGPCWAPSRWRWPSGRSRRCSAASAASAAVGPAFSCQSEIDFLTQSHSDGEATKYYESDFQIRGSRIRRTQLEIRQLELQRARLRPHQQLSLLDPAQRKPPRHRHGRHALPDRQHGQSDVAGGHQGLPGGKRRTCGRRLRPVGELLGHQRQWLDESLRDQRHQLAGKSDQDSHAQPGVETDRLDVLRRVPVGARRNQHLPR